MIRAPIKPEYIAQMNDLAVMIDRVFNGDLRGKQRKTGFVMLVFPYNKASNGCNYISNGAGRNDMVTLFKGMIERIEDEALDE